MRCYFEPPLRITHPSNLALVVGGAASNLHLTSVCLLTLELHRVRLLTLGHAHIVPNPAVELANPLKLHHYKSVVLPVYVIHPSKFKSVGMPRNWEDQSST